MTELELNNDIKKAMLANDKLRLEALRAIKAAILLAKAEKGAKDPLSDETLNKILQKQAKQRREALQIYMQQNRLDLAQKEEAELLVIKAYLHLPVQLSKTEVLTELKAIIKTCGAVSLKDKGKVMALAMKKLGTKTDGKTIADCLPELFPAD